MRRFILASSPAADGVLRLEGKDFHYLVGVLRKSAGDRMPVFLPNGMEAELEFLAISRHSADCRILSQADNELDLDRIRRDFTSFVPPLVLLQALPKGPKMDLIIRQATEAGVALVIPFAAERSVVKYGSTDDLTTKGRRWERIVKEARQQSGSTVATQLRPALDLREAVRVWASFPAADDARVALLFHQDPLAQASLHGYLNGRLEAVAMVIGPEGGFSPVEIRFLLDAGFLPLLLGPTVLRTETAALYSIAAVQVVLMEKKAWIIKSESSR